LGKAQSLVNVGFILDQLHHDRRQAIAAYQSIVGSKINDPDMINPIMPIVQRDQIMLKNPLQPDPMSPLGWERLVSLIAEEYGIEEETLISPCRVRKVVAARNRLIFEAINLNLCSRSELARWLNMDPSRISRVLYQYLKEKGEIRRISQ
jgi:chromosomal replication initiation ATPase DnaA